MTVGDYGRQKPRFSGLQSIRASWRGILAMQRGSDGPLSLPQLMTHIFVAEQRGEVRLAAAEAGGQRQEPGCVALQLAGIER
jgi:hypothetical protein